MTKKNQKQEEAEDRPLEFVITTIRAADEYPEPGAIELHLSPKPPSEAELRKMRTAEMLDVLRESQARAMESPEDSAIPITPELKVEPKKAKSLLAENMAEAMEVIGEQVQAIMQKMPATGGGLQHVHAGRPLMVLIRKEKYLRHRYMVGDVVTVAVSPPMEQAKRATDGPR